MSVSYGHFENGSHHQSFAIYYEDTDAVGIVYYANYLKFAERARTDALRSMGISQAETLEKYQLGFVVSRCEVDYLDAARLDDEISVQTQLLELRKVRMSMGQIITRNAQPLVKLVVKIAMVDANRKPARIPDAIVQALTQHLTLKEGE